jgi:hypothetical protein
MSLSVSLSFLFSDLLMMKNTKTATVPTVVIDAKIIEAIAYNITVTAQIQPSMSEPADVSLPLPSSDPLMMKDTKTAAVPRVVAKPPIQPSSDLSLMKYTKMAVVPRMVVKPQIQPSSMSEFADGADDHPSAARRAGPSSPSLRGRVRRRKLG